MDGFNICPDLLFLTTWHSFAFEEKVKKYTSYICHETNLFLYFKDKEFFQTVVKPFLINKHEKSLIDLYLLEKYDEIIKYATVGFYDSLNSVEKVLLISVVIHSDFDTAKMLAERIRINAENIDANQEYRNICFDAVIKAFYQDEEGHKETEMDVDDLADSRNMDSLPMGAEVPETPPDTAGIMGRRGMSSDNTLQRYGAKGVRSQNSSQNLKRNRKRKSGGKTNTKRKAKAERMNNFDSASATSDEIGYMFNDDNDERHNIRTLFRPMEVPSEY